MLKHKDKQRGLIQRSWIRPRRDEQAERRTNRKRPGRAHGGSGIRFDNVWRFGRDGKVRMEIAPRLTINDVAASIAAAKAGAGIANELSYQVADELRCGQLVSLLEDQVPPALPVQLLYHASRASMPGVRAFIEAMRRRSAQEEWREELG